jgi:hypothetical protein
VHVRISTYAADTPGAHVDLEPFDEALDTIASLDGFEGGYLLVDEESGAIRTVTVWRDHGALVASRVRATSLRIAAARACGTRVSSTVELRLASRRDPSV